VPPTEKRGRVHTSTVTVAVIEVSQQSTSSISIDDCTIEWFSGSGAGGQHRNKHQNCCRIRHLPTGIIESSQCRTRTQSQTEAFNALKNRVLAHIKQHDLQLITIDRKNQVGSGQRGDKIRTIQFQNDTVIDHFTGMRMQASRYMKGYMHELWRK
jgi:peptide chain release factor 1